MIHGQPNVKCSLVALKENEAVWKTYADMKIILQRTLELYKATGVSVSLFSV
jgi:hypothetical protein